MDRKHQVMVMYAKGADQKLKWLREEEAQAIKAVDFQAYGGPL